MFRRNTLNSALVLAAGLAATACGDKPSPVAPEPATRPLDAAAQRGTPGLDGRFLELSRQVPGFGGYFFDSQGDLNVYLTDLRHEPAARAALADVALSRPGSAVHPFTRSAATLVRQGNYDFPQLNAWRERLREAFSISGVQSLDTDEAANRVRVGVTSADAGARVRALAERAGVPAGALAVQVESPIQLLSTVRDYTRPTVGGLQIDNSGCTLGLNVWYSNAAMNVPVGTAGFFTASHCSAVNGVTEGSVETQGGVQIGHELYDPAYFDHAAYAGCPTTNHCRWSDASFYAYDAGVSWQLGAVARTLFRGIGLFQSGSIDVDPTNPRFTLVAGASPVVGTYLSKVGRTTGWTEGPVAQTCADVLQRVADHLILCQDRVDAYASGGDSGSPMFQWTYSGSTAYVAGIVWARTLTPTDQPAGGLWFSSTARISNDFGIGITWF
ncbi:MAG TPA: alpha-lytic protease prodomain-containing protein [Longimicrobium sp.]|jgi:hypothetical protein|nr:alpha-lytic protease prodomain-containing protein [Longimicrobium sp.]